MKNDRKGHNVRKFAALSLIAGSLGAISPISASAEDVLAFTALGSGAEVRAALGNSGANGIGGRSLTLDQQEKDSKGGEGKCGEGKCGEESGDEGDKGTEGKCGEGKCG